jgi:hypothetical protein
MTKEELLKKDDELREFVKAHPKSATAWAYRLGWKDAKVSLQPSVEKLNKIIRGNKNVSRK